MKHSISNLAWKKASVEEIAPHLLSAGLQGVEIAPTAIWEEAPNIPSQVVRAHANAWNHFGLEISGVQSLLFGHPELQVFDRSTWPELTKHLQAMIRLTADLGSGIAVFGSPRNRQRGSLDREFATQLFAEFMVTLLPTLRDCGVTLTLEPNAPAYGADFLTTYAEAVATSDLIASPLIRAQIDTGCMTMVGDDPVAGIFHRSPTHVHISAPNLQQLPGPIDHSGIFTALKQSGYEDWLVLEMLAVRTDSTNSAFEAARWLTQTYSSKEEKNEHPGNF